MIESGETLTFVARQNPRDVGWQFFSLCGFALIGSLESPPSI
jgi:hypothetical protein